MNIFTQFYLPFHFRVLAVALIILSPLIGIEHPIVGTAFFILGLVGATVHYRLKVTPKKIHEYVWLLGLRFGKPIINPKVEDIYINRLKVGSGYGFVRRINIEHYSYKAFFKMINGETVDLIERKKELKVLRQAQKAAKILKKSVIENFD